MCWGKHTEISLTLKWGAQNFSSIQHRNPPLPNVIVTSQAYNGDFPGGPGGKEPACQCQRCKRQEFDPWVRKIPLEEEMATHSSILVKNPMDRRAWRALVHRLQSWTRLKRFSSHPDVQRVCPKWFHCIRGQDDGPFSGLFKAVWEQGVLDDPRPFLTPGVFLSSHLQMSVHPASPGSGLITSYPLFFDWPIVLTRSFLEKFFLSSKKLGLPWWLRGKESTHNAGDLGFGSWVGSIPWRREWQPTPVLLPG